MELSSEGMLLIERHEGFEPFPYLCPANKLTVGYGHVIRPHEKGMYDAGITKLQAKTLLKRDIIAACNSVDRLVRAPLSQGQFDALVSFVFNLGGGRLQSSTLRQKLNRFEYAAAADEFGKWVYGGGRKLPGLVRRRAEEKNLFMEGVSEYKPLPWQTEAA